MFFENDETELELSSSDSELELLEMEHQTDTLDRTSDISDNLSDSSWTNEHFEESTFSEVDVFSTIINEGRRLYLIFLQEEILKSRMKLPDYVIRANKIIDCSLCQTTVSFHKLLNRFELSAQRKFVREQAKNVVFQGLNFKVYAEKLRHLFEVTCSVQLFCF